MGAEIKIDQFFWWLSDTSTRLWLWQTPYSENIDFRRDPEFIKLSRSYENFFDTGTNLMLCALDEKKYSHSFYAGENGTIYADNGNLVYTLTGWQNILNAIKFGDKYIFLYENLGKLYIMKIDAANANNVAWLAWDVNEDYWIYPSTHYDSNGYLLAVNDSDDFLYITAGAKVIRLDQSSVISEWITLEEDITWLTRHGGQYRLYTRDWLLYSWDWFSLQHDWYVSLNTYVRYVFNNSWIDYVVWGTTWAYSSLYYAQWFWKQLLKKAVKILDQELYMYDIANVWGNYTMAEFNGIVYMTDTDHWRIESVGQEYPGYPLSYSIDNTITDYINIWMIYRENRSPFIIFSYKDTSNNWHIARINAGIASWYTYSSNWMWYSQKYSFDHVQKKRSPEVNTRADIPTGTNIDIQYSIDWGSWQPLATLIDGRSRFNAEVIDGYFFEIQFRFLLSTIDDSKTPKLYDVSIWFEEVKD